MRARKKQFSTEELIKESCPLIQRVLNHPRLQNAKTVLLYNSLPDEVYTHDLIKQLHNEGRTILLPVVISDTEMELRLYRNSNSFETSSYGILEPIGEAFTNFSSIEFALIPGMAFDKERNRLGRGKGYYDRFLKGLSPSNYIGVAWEAQIMKNPIPMERYDQRMPAIVTEQGVIHVI